MSSPLQRSRQGPRRWLLRLAVVLVAGVAALVWFARSRTEQHLTVENRSGQPIPELQITVAGQSTSFRDVAAGKEVSAPTKAQDGDTFDVEGRLADGKRLHIWGKFSKATHRLLVLPGGEPQFERPGRSSLRWPADCRWTAVAARSPPCPT